MAEVFGVGVTVALVVGFLAGFFTFKRSLRWCPRCGEVLRCPECPGRSLPVPAASKAAAVSRRSL
jgi:hypothetical protein